MWDELLVLLTEARVCVSLPSRTADSAGPGRSVEVQPAGGAVEATQTGPAAAEFFFCGGGDQQLGKRYQPAGDPRDLSRWAGLVVCRLPINLTAGSSSILTFLVSPNSANEARRKVEEAELRTERLLERVEPLSMLGETLSRNLSDIRDLINQARRQAASVHTQTLTHR